MAAKSNTLQDLAILLGVGVVGYIVYNIVSGVKTASTAAAAAVQSIVDAAAAAGEAVNDSVVNGIAKIWTAYSLPPDIRVTGAMRLPSGLVVPASQLGRMVFDDTQNAAFFNYMGIQYQVAPNQYDAQGNFIATEVPDFGLQSNSAAIWN